MSVIEQTPQYTLTRQDDGREEKFLLIVQLPGVDSAAELDVVVRPAGISVRVPGRYKLELMLDPPVVEKPELLRFVKKKAQLKAVLLVAPHYTAVEGFPAVPPAAAAPTAAGPTAAGPTAAGPTAAGGGSAAAGRAGNGAAERPGAQARVAGGADAWASSNGDAATGGAGVRSDDGRGATCGGGGTRVGAGAGSSNGAGSGGVTGASGSGSAAGGGIAGGSSNSSSSSSSRPPSRPPVHDSFYEGALAGLGGKGRGGGKGGQKQPAAAAPAPAAASAATAGGDGGERRANGAASSQSAAAGATATATAAPGAKGGASANAAGGVDGGASTQLPQPQPQSGPGARPPHEAGAARSQPPGAARPQPPGAAATGAGASARAGAGASPGVGAGAAPVGAAGEAVAANGGPADTLYAAAKSLANREAAQQWLERALAAVRDGDGERARLLLTRAVALSPELEERLTAEYNQRCDPEQRIPRSHQAGQAAQHGQAGSGAGKAAGPPPPAAATAATAGAAAPGGASGGSAESKAQQQQQQQRPQPQQQRQPQKQAASANGAGGTGAGRPSQPYPNARHERENVRPAAGGRGGAAGGGAAGGSGSAAANGPGGTGPSATGGSATGPAGRAARNDGPAGRGGPAKAAGSAAAGAQRQGPQAQGQPQGSPPPQQGGGAGAGPGRARAQNGGGGGGGGGSGGGGGPGPSVKPEPRARPPPRRGGADAGGSEGGAADEGEGGSGGGSEGPGGGGGEKRWDWFLTLPMRSLRRRLGVNDEGEWREDPSRPAWRLTVYKVVLLVVFCAVFAFHLVVTSLAALLTWLYDALGYPEEAAGLQRYCLRYARWMLGCAAVTGLPLLGLGYVCWGAAAAVGRAAWTFLFGPPLWLAAVQTAVLYGAISAKRRPLLALVAPLPLLWCLAGSAGWRALSLALYVTAQWLAPGRTRAGLFAGAVSLSARGLLWYQALPAVLLEGLVWLMLSAAAASGHGGGGGDGDGGGARGRGGSGGGGGGRGGGDEVPRGGRLAAEHVKGATGDIARVLAARDHFAVLGLSADGPEGGAALTDEAVRSAFRRTQLRVHPDKAGPDAAGAEQASKRVNEAYRLLQTADARKRLLDEMAAPATPPPPPPGGGGGAAGGGGGDGFEAGSYGVELQCWGCHRFHTTRIVSMDCSRARYCSECRAYHPAADNDVWVWEDPEAFLFPARRMRVCLRGMVLDITEMARCCGMFHDSHGKRLPANTHNVQYKLGGGGGSRPSASGGGGAPHRGGTKRKGTKRK